MWEGKQVIGFLLTWRLLRPQLQQQTTDKYIVLSCYIYVFELFFHRLLQSGAFLCIWIIFSQVTTEWGIFYSTDSVDLHQCLWERHITDKSLNSLQGKMGKKCEIIFVYHRNLIVWAEKLWLNFADLLYGFRYIIMGTEIPDLESW